MKEVKSITRALVSDWEIAQAKAGKLEGQIQDRITYVLEKVVELLDGGSLDYWYFHGAEEGEVGDLSRWMGDEEICNFVLQSKRGIKNKTAILKDGSEWKWQYSIPTRWLFEDFETELQEGLQKHEVKERARKEAAQQRKHKNQERNKTLAAKAKSKLTAEELAALKKTL